jgi:spore coat protein CotF
MLKQRACSTATTSTYKPKVARFCKETVAEGIAFRKAILELWRQNSMTNTQDRVANIILGGDLLTGFEEKIQELTNSTSKDRETEIMEITNKNCFRKLICCCSSGLSFQCIGKPKIVDATLHGKSQGTFNLKDCGCC